MNAALRHLSVRLWLTALAGGMAGIFLLPWWQQLLGIKWLGLPAAVMMAGCYAGVGWVMNLIGLGFLKRHVNEAGAWERAGMMAESETAFGKAMATFDSFWISPLSRRGKRQWFSGWMARFYLGRHSQVAFPRSLVASHLRHYPQDITVAEPWLEQLLAYEEHLPEEFEAVDLVSRRTANRPRIQRLLMQFYMASGRVDFDALQTYRRVWHGQGPLPDETVRDLARVLLNEFILNHWALQVYLKAYEAGDQAALEGIAAAVDRLPATEESRPHLKAAEKIMAASDRPPSRARHRQFRLEQNHSAPQEPLPAEPEFQVRHPRAITDVFSRLKRSGGKTGDRTRKWIETLSFKRVAPPVAVVLVVALMAVAGWRYGNRPDEPKPAPTEPEVEEVVITDPFTIQVAAYLKSTDAQRLVDQLIKRELDAFWTQAASTKRTWYQVKVSHFPSRNTAQAYGRKLKSQGLIDDFYVANYDHQARKGKK